MNNQDLKELFNSFLINYQEGVKNKIWEEQSLRFRKFWNERIIKASDMELTDDELDAVIKILDSHGKGNTKDTEAIASLLIPQVKSRTIFRELRKDKTLSACIDIILKTNSSEERRIKIDELYELNQGRIKNLTGRSGNAINCLIAAYDPFNNLSIVSLNDRFKLIKSLEIDYSPTNDTIGAQIVKTADLIKIKFNEAEISTNCRTISCFVYSNELRNLWRSEKDFTQYAVSENDQQKENENNPTKKVRYWLYAPGRNAKYWDKYYQEGIIGIGTNETDDLRFFTSKEDISKKLQEIHKSEQSFKNDALAFWEFLHVMRKGDIIIAKGGTKNYLGFGIVDGEYSYDTSREDYYHIRKVKWTKRGVWEEIEHPIVQKTLTDITKYKDYVGKLIKLIGIEESSKNNKKVWIEKTLVKGNMDRIEGDRAIGLALWSPQTGDNGADIYKNMRFVRAGDVILHLTDNEGFSGISIVENEAIPADGLKDTAWPGPAYLIKLEKYLKLEQTINRAKILNNKNKAALDKIAVNSEVFYNKDLNLRQGAYLTPCPVELLSLINREYFKMTSKNLPYVKEIIEGIMPEKDFDIKQALEDFTDSGFYFNSNLLVRFIGALLTKPFVILTGLSGSGKTKLAQIFSSWICANENQICLVPIGADWTNREPLLGYPNALEKGRYVLPDNGVLNLIINAAKPENLQKPFFLILDEMNLSHVERYFADFLSCMESGEPISLHPYLNLLDNVPSKIKLPDNLFVIGTVNVDETTYMFSPKVLDRANVIEFRVSPVEMEDYLKKNLNINLEKIRGAGSLMSASFLNISKNRELISSNMEDLQISLLNFFKELKKVGAEFGYRSASEITRFAAVINRIESNWEINSIIDAAIMQKLLPKVHGSRRKLEPVLKTLATLCLKNELKNGNNFKIEDLLNIDDDVKINEISKHPVSYEKIARMYKKLIENGFSSYAEA
ncbi:MAG: hypothetical protein JXB49_08350 [Bacteroidales bacterium]|nr:hypothetical protein [Bacteroidales bacterium]